MINYSNVADDRSLDGSKENQLPFRTRGLYSDPEWSWMEFSDLDWGEAEHDFVGYLCIAE